ncbi:MAG: hypothetical protein R6W75_06495 [Smithellaceae bacterium]
MMKNNLILAASLLCLMLWAAAPSMSLAEEEDVVNDKTESFQSFFAERLHPLQKVTGYASVWFSGNADKRGFLTPLSGVWMVGSGFYRFLLPGLTATLEWGSNLQLTTQSNRTDYFDFPRESLLKSDWSAGSAGYNSEPDIIAADERRPVLATMRHKDIYDGLISLSYPIAATRFLTITPIVSYSLSVNGGNRQELRYRGITGGSDTIVYSGLHIIYTF